MRAFSRLLALVLLLALQGSAMARRGRPAPIPCPDDPRAALAAECPCDAATSHGQYVGCAVRFWNALRRSGCAMDAARGMVSCAARSTCGKPTAVVCCLPRQEGMRARITRDEARCAAGGGAALGSGTACGACLAASTSTTSTSSSTSSTSSSSTTSTSTSTSTTVAVGGVYGNAVEYPTASAHVADYLVGGPMMVTAPAMLTHLCVIAKATGPNVVLGLYSSNAMGEPDQLMASSPATPLDMGAVEVPVTPTMLPAGKYWMFGVYDADASIGIDESDPTAAVRYASQPFGSPLPAPFGPAATYAGQRFNYYVRTQ